MRNEENEKDRGMIARENATDRACEIMRKKYRKKKWERERDMRKKEGMREKNSPGQEEKRK